jgi:hypothetical protein
MKHNTIVGEPQEAPITPEKPEIKQPADLAQPEIPEEAPENTPLELPQTDYTARSKPSA